MLVYVDDMVIVARKLTEVQWFKTKIAEAYKAKDLGEIRKILGIEVTRDRKKRTITLDQTAYVDEIMKSLSMETDKHYPTTIPLNSESYPRPAMLTDKRTDQKTYQRIIGGLNFLNVCTRPDIAFSLSKLRQFMCDLAEHHMAGLKHLLRSIRSSRLTKIIYKPNSPTGNAMDPRDRLYGFHPWSIPEKHRATRIY